jgi:hypothetical protein
MNQGVTSVSCTTTTSTTVTLAAPEVQCARVCVYAPLLYKERCLMARHTTPELQAVDTV